MLARLGGFEQRIPTTTSQVERVCFGVLDAAAADRSGELSHPCCRCTREDLKRVSKRVLRNQTSESRGDRLDGDNAELKLTCRAKRGESLKS